MTNNEFLRVCKVCKNDSKKMGRRMFVRHRHSGGFVVSYNGAKGWLYSAYPGGRHILSIEGKELLEK